MNNSTEQNAWSMRKDFNSLLDSLHSSNMFIVIGALLYNWIPILITLFYRDLYYKVWYVNPHHGCVLQIIFLWIWY
jgi:hypothetical protein